jgi:ABC-type lipoprotein release transport system permease subunit
VKGILKLAYKLLVNDKSKFTALLVGITFASFLMIFIASMFAGVMNHSLATVTNIGASMWVMDPTVRTPANSIGMPDYILDAVRSMPGVSYAVPLYSGTALVLPRLPAASRRKARMSVRGSSAKLDLEFVRTQPLVSPKIELSDQRNERVDVRVLLVIFRIEKSDNLNLHPGELVDVYISTGD